jgi:orotidine-5'-phosphate decarboxylase
VATPAAALAAGADAVVLGRPVTGAADPRAVLTQILEDLDGVAFRRNLG